MESLAMLTGLTGLRKTRQALNPHKNYILTLLTFLTGLESSLRNVHAKGFGSKTRRNRQTRQIVGKSMGYS
jgi:hypothetical protein